MILRVAHHHPGRLRLRSKGFEGGGKVRERATRALRGLSGVNDVSVAPHTGSVLVAYDPERIGPDAIALAVARAAGLELFEPARRHGDEEHPIDVVIDVARELNAGVSELTQHKVDLRLLVPAALAGAGAYAFIVSKESRLPRWETLVYWAYSVFSIVNQREIERKTAP
jgi:hypothetical protein